MMTLTPFQFPTFNTRELDRGCFLGQGQFGVVYEIKNISLITHFDGDRNNDGDCNNHGGVTQSTSGFQNQRSLSSVDTVHSLEQRLTTAIEIREDDDCEEDEFDVNQEFDTEDVRIKMKRRCLRDGMARFAIKTLKKGTVLRYRSEHRELDALSVEADFLARLEHPNIIKMRGTGDAHPMDSEFFLVLDRLYGTLEDKIRDDWKLVATHCKPSMLRTITEEAKIRWTCLWIERLVIAIDLCSAIQFLHNHNIVYRNLKPENVGLDARETVKLFDFCLAKELKDEDLVDAFTGFAGSRRYMAPEMVLKKPYNTSLDIYSFGMLLWALCALEEPFNDMDVEKHRKSVSIKGQRPKCSKWAKDLKCAKTIELTGLIEACWSADISLRPSSQKVYECLKTVVNVIDRSRVDVIED